MKTEELQQVVTNTIESHKRKTFGKDPSICRRCLNELRK